MNNNQDPMEGFKLEHDLVEAAKEVARKEQAMFDAEVQYQEAYDAFKMAQQELHNKQVEWLKFEQDSSTHKQLKTSTINIVNNG